MHRRERLDGAREFAFDRALVVHLLEELALGWLHGEGYIDSIEQVRLRPCATDLGFWADVPEERLVRPDFLALRPEEARA